ncbi:hypothetical protein [Ruegeria sp. HKCCE4148]|uniref:hypothetical protein n=1 Tax=Ruegeria sp. HKCCE4148 TaxID=2794829 RepID=UPI001AE45DDA|nr:hypothetical protein [Ruegeria sp. HKCCE4148]
MAHELRFGPDRIVRRDSADLDVGNAMRRQTRDMIGASDARPDSNSPWNEAFSFTMDEYEILQKLKPELFDTSLDPATRLKHWKTFANSSEGRMFRVK